MAAQPRLRGWWGPEPNILKTPGLVSYSELCKPSVIIRSKKHDRNIFKLLAEILLCDGSRGLTWVPDIYSVFG